MQIILAYIHENKLSDGEFLIPKGLKGNFDALC